MRGVNRRMDVSYQMEQPTESDPSLRRVAPASQNPLIHCYGCEDILLAFACPFLSKPAEGPFLYQNGGA